ncbi:MAG: 2-oxo acid dehydrogenase subunit E2 [Phycisphaerales bacterium]|nr:2-oxo acid dehydrogenase subunit E2 [Phycisphaerales bacterium]
MPIDITMPRLSDTMEQGTIIKWHVTEGQDVSAGDVLADVETDKATMEMQSFDDGRIASLSVAEGEPVDIGTVVAVLLEEDESDDAVADTPASQPPPVPPAETPTPPAVVEAPASGASSPRGSHLKATPVARRLAEEHGVDLQSLQGSGPGGRIVKRDVLAAVGAGQETRAAVPPSARGEVVDLARTDTPSLPATPVQAAPMTLTGDDRREPVSSMRQTIARRLVQSKQEIPHYQVSMAFAMDELSALRKQLNGDLADQDIKLSINDLLVRACALAMHQNPLMNASWDGDAIVYHERVHIGVAVALPEERGGGLVVPVIRDANFKSLRAISTETRALAEKARTRGLSVEEMEGATFTISNLGMFGVDNFTAIINPPNSAILAVGATLEKPVVRDGELAVGLEMNATLSNDHRVIDGATAARWLGTFRSLIEHPSSILV